MSYYTNNKNELDKNWTKLPNEVITATKITNNTTGETIDFNFKHVAILLYMQQRQAFFKSNRSAYFESWDSILSATLGTTYQRNTTAKNLIRQMVDFGLIGCDKRADGQLKPKGAKTVITMQQLRDRYQFSNPHFEEFNKEENQQQRKEEKQARLDKHKQQSNPEHKLPKVNNYPIVKKYRQLWEDNPEKLRAWNKYAIKFDKANREITNQDVVDFTRSYQETLEPATAKPEPFVFTPSIDDHHDPEMDTWGDEEEGLEQCAEDFVLHDAELTPESDFNSDRVTDGDKGNSKQWLLAYIENEGIKADADYANRAQGAGYFLNPLSHRLETLDNDEVIAALAGLVFRDWIDQMDDSTASRVKLKLQGENVPAPTPEPVAVNLDDELDDQIPF